MSRLFKIRIKALFFKLQIVEWYNPLCPADLHDKIKRTLLERNGSMESLEYLTKILDKISCSSLENIQIEEQNKEYEGITFSIGKQTFRSRKAKKTPKKSGYFVVFWEKDEDNRNQAYTSLTAPDKLVITVFDQEKIGQFIFPKEILVKKHILSHEEVMGKMALRVYPDWAQDLNSTAAATQKWQSPFFIDLTNKIDFEKLEQLYFASEDLPAKQKRNWK